MVSDPSQEEFRAAASFLRPSSLPASEHPAPKGGPALYTRSCCCSCSPSRFEIQTPSLLHSRHHDVYACTASMGSILLRLLPRLPPRNTAAPGGSQAHTQQQRGKLLIPRSLRAPHASPGPGRTSAAMYPACTHPTSRRMHGHDEAPVMVPLSSPPTSPLANDYILSSHVQPAFAGKRIYQSYLLSKASRYRQKTCQAVCGLSKRAHLHSYVNMLPPKRVGLGEPLTEVYVY